MFRRVVISSLALALLALPLTAAAQERIRLATTTSTENSGLLGVLLPPFEREAGIKVDVISVGTGKALALGASCDVDLVMVHAPDEELKFVEKGHYVARTALMHNFFALVGPAEDPAGIKGAKGAAEVMKKIAAAQAPFVSRGDKSGTHFMELDLWKAAGVTPNWPGYKEAGQGMGAVLTMTNELRGYTLTDTGTFLQMQSAGKIKLAILFMQDDLLKNPYHVMLVNPEKCPAAKRAAAKKLLAYLVSAQGQKIIREFKADGQQLFWPDAVK